ncbi:coiled-coil domain-containing protein 3 isoform X2 [Electrophorus electricus]|uniref:coiled-coil domain-containing protein 3 isoform X2 n=1 Tax=Electrophorus electricus TaxID=8005 RepID=UPI000F0A2433|nr:coiled-coil domain-containing protein 3 isoform X2 [Electrophorus electricus]
MGALLLLILASHLSAAWGCQLPHDWRPQTESCRAELAEIIVFAKVLAIYKESYSVYNYLPWQYDTDLFFSAEIELLCDQAWGSMLEVPAGSRFNVTGLGYFPCYSYSVVENNSYYIFLRMDENYSIIPHGVNFQDPIFPDTPDNHRMFANLFQFSNCTAGTQVHMYTPEWEAQEDSRVDAGVFHLYHRGQESADSAEYPSYPLIRKWPLGEMKALGADCLMVSCTTLF